MNATSVGMQILSYLGEFHLTSFPDLEEAHGVSPCTFISTFLYFTYIGTFMISPLNQL